MLEVTACMVIIACILSIIIPSNVEQVQNAQYQKTVTEMKAIAQASIDYLESVGSCPTAISQLAPMYMTQAVTSSPFGSNYLFSCTSNMVSVSNLIPSGLVLKNPDGVLLQISPPSGGNQNITITETVPNAFTSRLLYENKYLY